MQAKRAKLISERPSKRRIKEVTVGIVVACEDGVVIGADKKVTKSRGTRIKSLEDKITRLSFRDGRNILFCYSGNSDFARRAIDEIDPSEFDDDTDCSIYRDMIESRIVRLQSRLSNRGIEYDTTLLFGTIDLGDIPTIGHITPLGITEMKSEGYFTTGIAAPYAELVLQDSYDPNISIIDAKLIVGGLIDRIGKVDNDVEGVDVYSIAKQSRAIEELTFAERQGIESEPLSFDFRDELEDLKQSVDHWQKFVAKMDKRRERARKKAQQATEQ